MDVLAATVVMNARAGPLPLHAQLTTTGGKVLVQAAGTAYASSVGLIGVVVLLDGIRVGVMELYANETASHKALTPVAALIAVPAGVHFIDLVASTTTTSTDGNDFFTVTAVELGS